MNGKICLILLLFLMLLAQPQVSANDLALGKAGTTAGPVDIPIVQPADFNFKTRAQIAAMRQKEVLKHPELLHGKYVWSDDVFGQVEDGKPWWGLLGQAYYGSGNNSIKGMAEESRFILNPFLLAAPADIFTIPKNVVSESQLASHSYPMFYQPSGLRWWPKEGKAEVTYEVSSFLHQMSAAYGGSFNTNARLSLEVINARDLGLNYVYIPPTWAYNMKVNSPMTGTMLNPQFVHCGGSCGYPGGCNNMSPSTGWLDNFELTKVPARIILMFWKKAPVTGREPADMTFTVNFR